MSQSELGTSSGVSGLSSGTEGAATAVSSATGAGATIGQTEATTASESGGDGFDGLLGELPDYSLAEESELTIVVPARAGARVFVHGTPPGAVFDEVAREIRVAPDFTQGGRAYAVEVVARDGAQTETGNFVLMVEDTIAPPDPVVVSEQEIWNARLLQVALTTDDFLDPPGFAGREFLANVTIPDAASESMPLPMRIVLHGSGGTIGSSSPGDGERFGIAPSEPYVSWWTGQHSASPEVASAGATVPNTSQRRILHLIDWVRRTYPGLDTERIWVEGASMGGSGAFFLATRYAYHFAYVRGEVNMTAVRLAPTAQQTALEQHWGAASLELPDDRGMSVWERYDITRALRDDVNARNLFYFSVHGVNDSIIPFDHVSSPSPNTGLSWAEVAQELHVGHRIAWDQREHASQESEALVGWWYGELPVVSQLRRDLAFPAFTRSALDQDPPRWNADSQSFAGGDPRGMRNRFLAWDSTSIVDELDRFEIGLFVRTDPPATSIGGDYPLVGDGYTGSFPVTVDVTPRRIQRFRLLPGEVIHWAFGGMEGDVMADERGELTVPQLPLAATATTLVLTRTGA